MALGRPGEGRKFQKVEGGDGEEERNRLTLAWRLSMPPHLQHGSSPGGLNAPDPGIPASLQFFHPSHHT